MSRAHYIPLVYIPLRWHPRFVLRGETQYLAISFLLPDDNTTINITIGSITSILSTCNHDSSHRQHHEGQCHRVDLLCRARVSAVESVQETSCLIY